MNAVAISTKQSRLDPDLIKTDALLDIWARDGRVGDGGGIHPLEVMRLLHEGQILGETLSNDEVMIIMDQNFMRSPPRVKSFFTVWYKQGGSSDQKAKRLGMSRASLYIELKLNLAFFRGGLRASGLDV